MYDSFFILQESKLWEIGDKSSIIYLCNFTKDFGFKQTIRRRNTPISIFRTKIQFIYVSKHRSHDHCRGMTVQVVLKFKVFAEFIFTIRLRIQLCMNYFIVYLCFTVENEFEESKPAIWRAIAGFSATFNILMAVVWTPLVKWFGWPWLDLPFYSLLFFF